MRITYHKNSDSGVYVYDFRDGSEEQLTKYGANPQWSPVEDVIVFASQTWGRWDVFTIDANTGEQSRLTDGSIDKEQPSWSPDGTKILFTSQDNVRHGGNEIYMMDWDGSNPVNLTQRPGGDMMPVWSPIRVED